MLVGQGQIIVLIVILVIGMILGAGVAWWIASNRKPNTPEPEEDHLSKLRNLYIEQVSLWRERKSGKLGVLVGEQIVDIPKQLNEAQTKAMQALLKEWSTWLGIPAAAPAPVPVQPAAALITPPPVATTADPIPRMVTGPLSPAPVIQPAVVPGKPKSIVEQINDILQAKLTESTVHNKAVRLVEDPVHGVVVWIGIEHFNGVDQVTDPEVKALLREAAAEWEHHALPGPIK
jgi:hypothetical protein